MALYQLDTWEHNGRDDSDWYAVVYNDETDKLERVQTGTTRFAAALHCGPKMSEVTPEIRVRAKAALAVLFLDAMTHAEKVRVETPHPEHVSKGVRVKFLAAHRCMAKEITATPCEKCGGSGSWANPRNAADKRPCFACKGEGSKKAYSRAKTAEGGQKWLAVAKDATGTLVSAKTFGKFYKGGYNISDRENTTAIIVLDDGREVRAPLAKIRLDEEVQDMGKAALAAAEGENYYTFFKTAGVRI